MKMPAIVLLLAVWIFPAYKTAYSLSVLITPPEELVRNSDVIVTAKLREMLINSLCGMKCKAHGAQEPRHI